MTFPRIENAEEILDRPFDDPHELEDSLDHVAQVNRWLGGARALRAHLPELLPRAGMIEVLDVATGSADLPRALADWARVERRALRVTATDLHPQILDIARARCASYPEITVEAADALRLPYADNSFDVALLSMALHHFEGDSQVGVLREMRRVTRHGIYVGELARTRINYAGARVMAATLWRGNRVTRHDGPISVRRAFTSGELESLLRSAGFTHVRVYRHFFQRLAGVALHAA